MVYVVMIDLAENVVGVVHAAMIEVVVDDESEVCVMVKIAVVDGGRKIFGVVDEIM